MRVTSNWTDSLSLEVASSSFLNVEDVSISRMWTISIFGLTVWMLENGCEECIAKLRLTPHVEQFSQGVKYFIDVFSFFPYFICDRSLKPLLRFLVEVRGHDDNLQHVVFLACPEELQDLKSIHLRHFQIEQHDVRLALSHQEECLISVVRRDHIGVRE